MPKLELTRYMNDRSGRRKGCLYAYTDSLEAPSYSVGFSLCHTSDQFNKKDARNIAKARAKLWATKSKSVSIPLSLQSEMCRFLGRCDLYFKEKKFLGQLYPDHGILAFFNGATSTTVS